MRLIKELPAMNLAIYQLVQGTLWKQPGAIFDEHNALVGLHADASGDIARIVGLGGSAHALYNLQPAKFEMFSDLFQPGQDEAFLRSYFLGNASGTYLYRKIQEADFEALEQVELVFSQLVDREVTIKGAAYKENPALLAIEVSNLHDVADLTTITLFDLIGFELVCYAVRKIDNTLSVHKVYDKPIVGPKHVFQAIDVDYGTYYYDVMENPKWTNILAGGFRLSLREIIECLQAMTDCKPLASTYTDAELAYALRYGETPEAVKEKLKYFYEHIDLYTFFYDNTQTVVKNIGFLSEPKSTAKPHLYFALDVSAFDVIELISIYLNAAIDFVDQYEEYEQIEYDNMLSGSVQDNADLYKLVSKLKFFDKFSSRKSFDALEVPNYFDLIALGLAEVHDNNNK